jgi:hypothetical protein
MSLGSAPNAAATAWYQPCRTQEVERLQSASDRRPLHTTGTVAGASLRTTTACLGTAVGQSWVDQIRSGPEVILSTSEAAETSQVQAGDVRVVSTRVSTTGLAA